MRGEAFLVLLLIFPVCLPGVSGGTTGESAPAGDDRFEVLGLWQAPAPAAMGCHDPSIDVVADSATDDGTTLTIRLTVLDQDAPLTCQVPPVALPRQERDVSVRAEEGWAVCGPGCPSNFEGIELSARGTEAAGWQSCVDAYGDSTCTAQGPVGGAFTWTVPLTGGPEGHPRYDPHQMPFDIFVQTSSFGSASASLPVSQYGSNDEAGGYRVWPT